MNLTAPSKYGSRHLSRCSAPRFGTGLLPGAAVIRLVIPPSRSGAKSSFGQIFQPAQRYSVAARVVRRDLRLSLYRHSIAEGLDGRLTVSRQPVSRREEFQMDPAILRSWRVPLKPDYRDFQPPAPQTEGLNQPLGVAAARVQVTLLSGPVEPSALSIAKTGPGLELG